MSALADKTMPSMPPHSDGRTWCIARTESATRSCTAIRVSPSAVETATWAVHVPSEAVHRTVPSASVTAPGRPGLILDLADQPLHLLA